MTHSHLKLNDWFQIANEQLSNERMSQVDFRNLHTNSDNILTGETQPKGQKAPIVGALL